ncbi:MAG TPA: hypothetical protein VEL07_07330 [Planctomycetota bacterium]|nr:hypothetical protein [Planctomycetota bacterium]
MTAPDAPRPPSSDTGPWPSTTGTAVSSGQTSAYALKALQGEPPAARSGAYPRPIDASASGAHAKPDSSVMHARPASSAAHAQPPAAPPDRWAIARAEDFTCDVDTRTVAAPRRSGDDSVVGSITGFFKRCASWLNEKEKKHEEPMRTRSGMKVVTDPTPADGTLISLQYAERTAAAGARRDRAKEREVRKEAQRLAAAPDADPPTAAVTRRILEKQRQMAEVERQRAQAAKAEAAEVTILRRRDDA